MTKKMALAAVYALVLTGVAALPLGVNAQTYPSKPIRYIVPTSPGGVNDTSARVVAPRLSERLATPVIVENRPPNQVGTAIVAKAAPDGYTILNTLDNFPLTQFLMKDVPYDATRDFAGISLLWRAPQIAAIPAERGISDLGQFVRLAKSKPGSLNYGAAGAGTSGHLTGELFKSTAGIDMQVVQFKGAGPAVSAVLGGHIDFIVATMGTLLPHVKAGKLLALGVASPQRVPQLPNVPAIAETYPGFEAQGWGGIAVPAGTPQDIIRRLNAEATRVVAEPEVKRLFEDQGYEVVGSTPEAFDKWIANESQKWSRVIRERRITQN
jgi:tripartite-type tricarboxylate transporter receptor subunit TctC